QGYDAVLLCSHWSPAGAQRSEGVAWLQDLAGRPGFAPIVFFADRIDDDTARRARVFGAFGVLARSRVEHDELVDLLREASRRLHHSNIVRCHELGVADDHAYLAMEYFPDGDLRRRIRSGLNTEDALSIAIQIARALQALHSAGTLHRDLKPGNVLMRGSSRV